MPSQVRDSLSKLQYAFRQLRNVPCLSCMSSCMLCQQLSDTGCDSSD